MDINELKTKLENGSISSDGIIFKCKDTYIPNQYIKKISEIYNRDILYVDDIDLVTHKTNIFNFENSYISIFYTDKINDKICLNKFCYIICASCKNNDYVDVPKLEEWQMIDYAITNSSKSIDQNRLINLVKACNDMYLLDNEISKYNIFGQSDQKNIINSLDKYDQLVTSYENNIFDFTNALLDKDIEKVNLMCSNLEKYDLDPMAIISIVRKQLKNIITVAFNRDPTEYNTGLSSKQIYWIKKNLSKYSPNSIIENYNFICDADKYLKKGLLNNSQLFDFIIVNLL